MKKLLIFIFLSISAFSFASHNMGGDITYRYIGSASFPNRYEIIVTTYTKWLDSTSVDRCELKFIFGAGDSALVERVNGLSVNCPSAHDGELIGGCTGNVRMNLYTTSHDFPSNGIYTISIEDYNRSSGICNLIDSENQSFFLQTELIINPFLGSNNAPDYTSIPVICVANGIISYYNPSAIEPDGDSLYYELIPPIANGVSTVLYAYPPSSSSFSINNLSGTVTWDHPMVICYYIFDIRISEWRKISGTYYLVGKTMQEVWAEVSVLGGIKENNPSVSITAFPNPSSGFINFKIESEDQNSEYELNISNSLGQTIQTIAIKNNLATLDEGELSAGMYFYSLTNKRAIVNKGKFVILQGNMK
ncbi:MAG: T9SS type A sorting domain-containing protein [Bacteroidetes bacterium]|nr:T9SS type A sorting domain-containing protein [Bacteroidota bacterium]